MQQKKNILITGATGFVGSHILNKIIDNDDVNKVYLLIRNKQHNRFIKNDLLNRIERYDLKIDSKYASKIQIIYGTIDGKKLSLGNEKYDYLAEEIDVVYHVAAEVNHVKKYDDLKKANVNSVDNFLSFLTYKKPKIFNFISTMGAANNKDEKGLYTEDYVIDNGETLAMGYLQSKREAEKLIAYSPMKTMCNIFRLGYISGNSSTGVSLYENNQLMLFLKSCIQLKFAPDIKRSINLTPVDFTSSILANQHFRQHANNIIHLVNCREFISWREIIAFLNDKGYQIEIIDLKSWQTLLKKSGRDNALYRMILTYRRRDAEKHMIRFARNIHEYHLSNIQSFCKKNNIAMPKIKSNYLHKIFDKLIENQFLPEPNL